MCYSVLKVYIKMSNPQSTHQKSSSPAVEALLHDLTEAGAVPVEASFSVAGPDQAEVIFNQRRYLLTPNDEAYARYVTEMSEAGLRYVSNDSEIGNDSVVAGEISRTARAVPQVLRGNQPRGGQTINEVFYTIGQSLGILAQRRQLAPKAGLVVLQKILILRGENDIMIAPPIEFEPVTESTKQTLLEGMHSQLFPDYARFGATALINSFEKGLNNDSFTV